jgi:hypothetical protein
MSFCLPRMPRMDLKVRKSGCVSIRLIRVIRGSFSFPSLPLPIGLRHGARGCFADGVFVKRFVVGVDEAEFHLAGVGVDDREGVD